MPCQLALHYSELDAFLLPGDDLKNTHKLYNVAIMCLLSSRPFFYSATVEIALATAIAGFLHVVTRKLVATFMRPCRTFCARAPSGFEYK